MDPWEMFCELTRQVVEEQNCALVVRISTEGIAMQLTSYGDWEENEDDC